MTDDVFLANTPRGYARSADLQHQFDDAAAKLLALDGWSDGSAPPRLVADLALEGGGVKGIGLVGAILVLDEAGYTFRAVAGTSAGAIAAVLVAALARAGHPMAELRQLIASLDFMNFMPNGKLHQLLKEVGGKRGNELADFAVLLARQGVYSGDYLSEWLSPILHDQLGIKTFADLRLDATADPGQSLPPGQDYSLVVHTSDITRATLTRLPWDYPLYGLDPDAQDPVTAVRASMSIPFFFEPVHVTSQDARVTFPQTGGGQTEVRYAAGTESWVDGGLLANFPIRAFDRADGGTPRWPTIGVKLSKFQTEFAPTQACTSSHDVLRHIAKTLTGEWDSHSIDEATAARIIFVDHMGLTATDFDLTKAQQDALFLNGVGAATTFMINCANAGGVPLR
jgi:NTE family protein